MNPLDKFYNPTSSLLSTNRQPLLGMTGLMKSKIATNAHFGNPSAQRMVSPNPKWGFLPDGNRGTHYMGSYGKSAVPHLQDTGGERLQYMEKPGTREDIRFRNTEEAKHFAKHYKDVAPMSRQKFADGGLVAKKKEKRFIQLPEVTVESPRAEYNNPVYGDIPDTASPNWNAYLDSLDLHNISQEILSRFTSLDNEHLENNIIDIENTEEGHLRNLFVDDAALTQQIEQLELVLKSHDENDKANIEPIKNQLELARKQHEMITKSINSGIYPTNMYEPPFYKFGWTDQFTPLFQKPTNMPTKRGVVDKGEPTIITTPLTSTPMSSLPPGEVQKSNPYTRFGKHWGKDWTSTSGKQAPIGKGYDSRHSSPGGFYYKGFKQDGSHDILTPEEYSNRKSRKQIQFKK